jgi:hypothetical protein
MEVITRIADGHPVNRIGELAPLGLDCLNSRDGNGEKWWFRDCQLLAPVLLSLPQQNAPSGLRVPSRRAGGPWRARDSHDRRDIPPARRTDQQGAAHPP